MDQIWLPISENTNYSVSNWGGIKNNKTNRILKQHVGRGGYYSIVLPIYGHQYVHRIVAKTFILNLENKPQVNHIDGNKLNNNSLNLEWVNGSENMKHAYKIFLADKPKGIKHPRSKFTNSDIVKIRELVKIGISQSEISRIYKVNRTTISAIILKKRWSHINE